MSFITIPITIEGASFRNTAAGYLSLVNNTPGAFPNGEDNTGFGYLSLNQNTIGEGNSAFGSRSLALNTSGRFNVAIGERASYDNTTGQFNVSVGSTALPTSTNSDYNTAIGYGACGVLAGNVGSNTMVGAGAGALVTTGAKHTILGRYNGNQGGLDIRTASNYCVISDGDGNPRLYIDAAGLVTAPGGFAGVGGGITLNNRTSTYNIVASDAGKAINCTSGTFTVSTDPAATLGSGFACFVWNTGTGTITINPNGAETIDGLTTLVLRQGEGTQIVCDGTNWLTGSKKTMRAYAENIAPGTTRPSVTGSGSVAIGPLSQASGSDSIAIGGFSTAGNAQTLALGYGTQANPSYSCAIGQNSFGSGSQTATNFGAMALGGSYASGTDSFSAAIGNNTSSYGATGANSIAIGVLNQSQSNNSIAIGDFSTASATNSTAIGSQCSASAFQTIAIGNSAKSQTIGKYSYASGNFGSSADICQEGKYILRCATTNATPTVLTTDNTAPGSNDQIILQNNTAYAFVGTVVARQQASGGTQSAAWKIEGLIRREANAATTTLVASTVTVISNAPGWTLALSADTANGGLAITATGAVGTNIRWVATAATSEVNYA